MDNFTEKTDPIEIFKSWLVEAKKADPTEISDSFCLSTISPDGYPEGRILLLRNVSQDGFVFYTNSLSNKGESLENTPRAALTFHWEDLGYQVRIQGDVEKVSGEENDAYFNSRPRGSKIGAWASEQSSALESREILLNKVKEYETKFENKEVPRPDHWIGYRVNPRKIEFWISREYRLHDRFIYEKKNGKWQNYRLFP